MKRYLDALLKGDEQKAAQVVQQVSQSQEDPMKVSLELFYPAMVELGESWCRGKINVAQEHLATQITLAQMERLRAARQAPPRSKPRVLVASVEGEEHYLGAMMTSDAFRLDGWKVDFLGPNVPTRELFAIADRRRTDLLALSVTLASNLVQLRRLSQSLRKVRRPTKIIVGGAALNADPNFTEELGFDFGSDPMDGVRIARQLFRLKETEAPASLDTYLKKLGLQVRELRKKKGWTQQQLADRAAVDRTYVIAVEMGKQNLSLGVVMKVAGALSVPMERLVSLSASA